MLFNMISLDSTGSAVFATAVITFLNMVALMAPRPDFGVLLAYQWLKILDDFRGICSDGVCSSKGIFFFAFLCGLSCLPSTNCLGCTLYRLSINCLVHGIFCVWSCVWVWRIFIVFADAFLWIQHWWFMYTFALGLLFVPWHFFFPFFFGAVWKLE